ncbi:MAG: hypothetical protein BIFFINMI_01704 [Phycisphaerae bacterium]|nr:hypothetical protein [Phycisphaerae bacterium]
MIHARRMVALAAVAGLALLAGCNSYKQSTPKELLESMNKASQKKDFKGMAKLVEPDAQKYYDQMVSKMKEAADKMDDLADLVEKKIDKDKAKEMRDSMTEGPSFITLKKARKDDGSLDFDKIEIKEDGDKATVKVKDSWSSADIKKVSGKWYFVEKKSADELKKKVEETEKEFPKMIKALDEIKDGINKGDIKKDNFDAKCGEIMMKAMKD